MHAAQSSADRTKGPWRRRLALGMTSATVMVLAVACAGPVPRVRRARRPGPHQEPPQEFRRAGQEAGEAAAATGRERAAAVQQGHRQPVRGSGQRCPDVQ